MKKKQKLLVALMALTLAGGVGSALAATYTYNAASLEKANSFDSAIELNWGSGSSSVSIGNLSNLQAGVTKYRTLEVTPKSSKSVAGNVTLQFTIDVGTGIKDATDYSAEGLTLTVYETQNAATIVGMTTNASSEWINDTSYSGAGTETLQTTLEGGTTDTVESFTFAVSAGDGVHETAKHYLLKFAYSGALVSSGKTFGGLIKIHQSFTPAA